MTFGGYRSETSSGIPVDVILRDDEFSELFDEALDRVVEIDGIPTVPNEYLVAMKMLAGRRKDDGDLEFLLGYGGTGVVDMDRAEDVVRRHLGAYAVRELRSLAVEARWLGSRA